MGTPSRKPKEALTNNTPKNIIEKKNSEEKIPTQDNKLASNAIGKEISKEDMAEKEKMGVKVEIKETVPVKAASKDVKGMILYLYPF